eukprot:g32002.t1
MAIGPDSIPAIVSKVYALEPAAPPAKLFQYSYNTGIFPTMWNIAQICPVHKKQDNSKPTNYSLLSIVSKMMENVINGAIKPYLLSSNLLSDIQFGFHQGHSALDLITALVQTWTKELNSRVLSSIHNSSTTEAAHIQMQQDLDNIQIWTDE